ncbi:MAG: HEAT repeat domain-containing protein [Planctomycetes bacterium]|nr:HEAT repeat domain-containing protein [Planctomycetota bacterium]
MKDVFASKATWLVIAGLLCFAGLAWWQWHPVLAWYHVRQLSLAYQENREACAKKVAELDEAAVPRLLDGLQDPDALVCGNMQCALIMLVEKWGVIDARSQRLVDQFHARFGSLSSAGQEKTLMLLTGFLQGDASKPLPSRLTKPIGEILVNAEKIAELRSASLLLAAELVDCVEPGQWIDACREMAERGMKDERAGVRVASTQLLLRDAMKKDKALFESALPLLRDKETAVRHAAVIALSAATDVVREENLLPLLHDEDLKTQYLCELALRKRGLTDDDITLARLISDKDAAVRMRVFHHLHHMPEMNLAVWLRQLSDDPEPAVRAAAIRAAADRTQFDLAQRLREMAEADPSETVRLNARYYLTIVSPRTSIR